MEKERDELVAANLEQFLCQEHTDCVVTCRGYSWKLHKSVLCLRNPYFKALFSGSFSENSAATVELDDESPWAVYCFLAWIYTFSYPQFIEPICEMIHDLNGPDYDMEFHWTLFLIADKRQAVGLKEQALKALTDSMTSYWDEETFIWMLPSLWECKIKEARAVQRLSLDLAIKHQATLIQASTFFGLLSEVPEFNKCWVKKLVRENKRLQKRRLEDHPKDEVHTKKVQLAPATR